MLQLLDYCSEFAEYKQTYDGTVIQSIAAFLNSEGGDIIIGADKQTIYGNLDEKNIMDKFNEDLEYIYPKPIINLNYAISYGFERGSVKLIYITVRKSNITHFVIRNEEYTLFHRLNFNNVGVNYQKEDAEFIVFQEFGIKHFCKINTKEGLEYNQIGLSTLGSGGFIYKYMSLETALLCIRYNTIRFAEPSSWLDNYEKLFYNALIKGEKQSNNNPPLVACCLTTKQDNEAAWKIYSYDKKGLNSRCVEFTIDRESYIKQLLNALNENEKLHHYKLYEGIVTYKDERFINRIYDTHVSNYLYNAFFNSFSLEKYLSLLLLKRNAFLHEQEIRYFLIPDSEEIKNNNKGTLKPIDIPINWGEIIWGIRIDAQCTQFEKDLLTEEIFSKGDFGKPLKGRLWDKGRFVPKSYDVYEKKDIKPIVIE